MEEDVARTRGEMEGKNDGVGDRRKKSSNNIFESQGRGVIQHMDRELVFSSVQSLSRVQLFATPWIPACQASLSITNSRGLLKLMPI